MKKKVLFVTYGGGHVNIVIPIIEKLVEDPALEPEVLALTMAKVKLTKVGLAYKELRDFLSLFDKAEIEKIGEGLAHTYHERDTGLDFYDTMMYYGLGMWNLIKQVGEEEARERIVQQGRHAFNPVEVLKRIICQENPDLIVVTCEARSEKAAVIAGKELGVPTLRIMDLLCNNPSEIPTTDYVAVMNEYAKEKLVKYGIPAEKIEITGQPAFKDISSLHVDKNEILKSLHVSKTNKRRIILWVSQPLPPTKVILKNLINYSQINKNVLLLIKLHPNENEGQYIRYTEMRHSNFIFTSKDYNIQQLIQIADLVITQNSTSGLEAVLMKKPLLIVDLLDDSYDKLPLGKDGAAFEVTELARLQPTLDLLLNDTAICERVKEKGILYQMPEQPVERVIQYIKKIISLKE